MSVHSGLWKGLRLGTDLIVSNSTSQVIGSWNPIYVPELIPLETQLGMLFLFTYGDTGSQGGGQRGCLPKISR